MSLYLQPLKKYADFSGRASRAEYWLFYLFQLAVIAGLGVLAALAGVLSLYHSNEGGAYLVMLGLAFTVIGVGMFLPSLAVAVRRLHDRNMSGWMLLIGLVPYVGGLALFVMFCLPGDTGPNRFGEDPKTLSE